MDKMIIKNAHIKGVFVDEWAEEAALGGVASAPAVVGSAPALALHNVTIVAESASRVTIT